MSKIFHIDSSSRSADSITRDLSQHAIKALTGGQSQHTVKYRDLASQPVPFLTEAQLTTIFTPPDKRSDDQVKIWQDIENLIDDVISSDIYVFGVPMYNFTVPAAFKAFIDRIVITGKTFVFENGRPVPLLKGKKAYILSSGGGDYTQPPFDKMDFLEPYLRTIFGFIGITDITFYRVAGHSPEEIAQGVAAAKQKIDQTISEKAASKV